MYLTQFKAAAIDGKQIMPITPLYRVPFLVIHNVPSVRTLVHHFGIQYACFEPCLGFLMQLVMRPCSGAVTSQALSLRLLTR